jgi:PAS domain S-box-containing protein
MDKPPTPSTPALADPLRADAEAQAARLPALARPAGRVTALRHELQVHRIELEMQNEELRRSRDALEAARDRYIDLYDFAPVGYLTLDRDGLIVEANLTVARMLGIERGRLVGRRFARQVAPADRDRWHRLALASARSDDPGRIELLLLGAGGRTLDTQLDLLRAQSQGGGTLLRMALTDIAARKRAELYKRLAAAADAAREADSRRVSLQLHEGLGQRLCALKMDLEDLQGSPARLARQARDARVGAMLSEVDALVAMVRRMSSDLRPAMLDDLGLHAALEWLVHDTSGRLGLAMTLKQDDIEPPLDDAGALAVYRLVQAMLDWLPRHEHASDVAISVSRLTPGLVVCLQAQGLAPGGAGGTAQDVSSLGERVHTLGGQLRVEPTVESARPGTTRITVRVPLEAAQGGLRLRLSEALT